MRDEEDERPQSYLNNSQYIDQGLYYARNNQEQRDQQMRNQSIEAIENLTERLRAQKQANYGSKTLRDLFGDDKAKESAKKQKKVRVSVESKYLYINFDHFYPKLENNSSLKHRQEIADRIQQKLDITNEDYKKSIQIIENNQIRETYQQHLRHHGNYSNQLNSTQTTFFNIAGSTSP